MKEIESDFYEQWNQKYLTAAMAIENREQKLAAVAEEIETELKLVGISAIEDKLQECVPETIKGGFLLLLAFN